MRRMENRGFTAVEMVVVLMIFGVMAAVALPRALKTSPRQMVDHAAIRLASDLEGARARAMAAKRRVRVSLRASEGHYAAFMDVSTERSGAISETAEEARGARMLTRGRAEDGVPIAPLDEGVEFGAGAASVGPLGESISDAIELADDRVEFDARGLVVPLGGGGVIYLTYDDHPEAVAAVTVSGGGAFKVWRYRGGEWR